MNILLVFLALPLLSACVLFVIPTTNKFLLKSSSLIFSFIIFNYSIYLWVLFQPLIIKFQFFSTLSWIFTLNFCITLGLDSISLFFILLTTFLFIICILYNWINIFFYLKEYFILLFIIEFFLILIFLSLDLFLFYFFFESILIPMFLLIGVWGSQSKKIKAAYLFFFYTLIGSISFLIAIIYIYLQYGLTSYPLLYWITFSKLEQYFLWIAFFLSFAAKIPMIPFHIWLPEAHVEAPTTGSILLASILLKLGVYGFLRFLIPLFPEATLYFLPFIYSISIIGIIYPALTAFRQVDLKRIIAYSSISHMNLIVLGVFSLSFSGIQGAILQSISHGFVSSGLFFSIGFLYDRYHTRLIHYYSGLIHLMPLFSICLIFFLCSNISIPGTSNFIGELLIILNLFFISKSITLLSLTSLVLSSLYSLKLLNKIIFGNLKNKFIYKFTDLTLREFSICIILIILILILGIYPKYLIYYLSGILL